MSDGVRIIEHQGHFNAAWQSGDAEEALRQAKAMKDLGRSPSLVDAMRLVILMAHDRHPSFGLAAQRWLDRLPNEGRSPVEIEIAHAAVKGLQGPLARKCEIILRRLFSGEFPAEHPLDDMRPPAGKRGASR